MSSVAPLALLVTIWAFYVIWLHREVQIGQAKLLVLVMISLGFTWGFYTHGLIHQQDNPIVRV
jgi:hypothetical protein